MEDVVFRNFSVFQRVDISLGSSLGSSLIPEHHTHFTHQRL